LPSLFFHQHLDRYKFCVEVKQTSKQKLLQTARYTETWKRELLQRRRKLVQTARHTEMWKQKLLQTARHTET